MAEAAIKGGELDGSFLDFVDVLDAEALDVVVTLADYKAMAPGERAAWRAWRRARRRQQRRTPEQGAAAAQADPDAREAWLRARAAT